MAEEISLKITADGEVAKKTLGDLKKEVKELGNDAGELGSELNGGINAAVGSTANLKMQLRQMKEELANLPEGSAEFKKLATAAGEVQDKINMINQTIKSVGDNKTNIAFNTLAQSGQAIAGSFQAASGAVALFGGDAKVVENAIKNVIAIQGIMNGVMAINNVLQDDAILGMKLRNVALKLGILTTDKATGSQLKLNTAMLLNPFALVVVAIMAVVGAIVLLIKNLEYAKNVFLALFGLYDKQAMLEAQQAEARMQHDKEAKQQFANRKKEIEALIVAEKKAFDSRQTGFDLEIARMDAEGKSSRQLKLDKLQDILDHTKAVLANNELLIQNYIDYYKKQALLSGQSEQEFIDSMKRQGVDLVALQDQANAALQANRDAIYSAETNIIALKKQFRKEDAANAKATADEINKANEALYQAELKRLHDLQTQKNTVIEAITNLENAYLDSQLTAQQREENAVADKYFSLIEKAEQFGIDTALLKEAQAAELLAIEQKYIDLEAEAKRIADEKQKEADEIVLAEKKAQREKDFENTVATAENLIKIADSLNTIFHGKELARIKAKQSAGIALSKSEEARLRKEEKIQKAFALAQVVKDTATGIAGAVSSGAGVPFPGNLVAIAAGVASVLAGIANASKLLGGSPPTVADTATQAETATGNEDTPIPKSGINAGSTYLNQEPQMVYVLESAITNTQNNVAAIVKAATF